MLIRDETIADHAAIHGVVEAAFAVAWHAGGNEARIVHALRERDQLAVSLVAEANGVLIGHVALSPVALDDGTGGWFGLGPVAVAPEQQRRGIGANLIRQALARLPALGARGCVVLGDPAYYHRFGFRPQPRLRLAGVPAEFFMALPLGTSVPDADVRYSPAFSVA